MEQKWVDLRTKAYDAFTAGDLVRSKQFFDRALAVAKTFGPHDVRLAVSYQDQSEYYAARKLFREAKPYAEHAVRILEKALGPHHPNVLKCIDRFHEFRRLIKREAV